jgi:hypothetical protein
VLKLITGLAQATLPVQQAAASAGARAEPTAQQRLASALRALPPEMALKLRTLMVAGRDGVGIHTVKLNVTLGEGDAAFDAMASDSSENGPLLAEYLRRGHALACAAGLDLERPMASWASAERDLEERAWLSFGRQLANSQPDDWQCLTFTAPGTQQIDKLYLRLGERAWWSFQALLDRPSVRAVNQQQRARNRGRSKAVAAPSLKAIAARSAVAEGRALRRAVRAIRARLGEPLQNA